MKQRFDTYFPPTPGHASTASSWLETVPRRRALGTRVLEFVGLVPGNMRLLAKASCKKTIFKLSLYYEELPRVEDTAVDIDDIVNDVYVVSGLCGLLFAYACPLCTHMVGCEMSISRRKQAPTKRNMSRCCMCPG